MGDRAGIGCMIDSCQQCEQCKEHLEQHCSGGGSISTYNATYPDGTLTQGGYSTHYVVSKK